MSGIMTICDVRVNRMPPAVRWALSWIKPHNHVSNLMRRPDLPALIHSLGIVTFALKKRLHNEEEFIRLNKESDETLRLPGFVTDGANEPPGEGQGARKRWAAVMSCLDTRKMVVVVETSAVSKVSGVKTLWLAFEHEEMQPELPKIMSSSDVAFGREENSGGGREG